MKEVISDALMEIKRLAAKTAALQISDEMLNAHLKACNEWVEPFPAEYEEGTQISCGLTQEDADQINSDQRGHLRMGYTAAFKAAPPEQSAVTRCVCCGKPAVGKCDGPEQPVAAAAMFRCNCPFEARSGCSEPGCTHYTPPRKENP